MSTSFHSPGMQLACQTHQEKSVLKRPLVSSLVAVIVFISSVSSWCYAQDVKSNRVSLGDGDYRFVVTGDRLMLVHDVPGEKNRSTAVHAYDPNTSDGALLEIPAADVVEVELGRWRTNSLMAVVEVFDRKSSRYSYYCLTFYDLHKQVDTGVVSPTAALICESHSDMDIIAINGDYAGDAVVVVLGEMEIDDLGGKFESGYLFFHGAANPSASGGRLGTFAAEYPSKEEEEDNTFR